MPPSIPHSSSLQLAALQFPSNTASPSLLLSPYCALALLCYPFRRNLAIWLCILNWFHHSLGGDLWLLKWHTIRPCPLFLPAGDPRVIHAVNLVHADSNCVVDRHVVSKVLFKTIPAFSENLVWANVTMYQFFVCRVDLSTCGRLFFRI